MHDDNNAALRHTLRRHYRQRRRDLSAQAQQVASQALSRQLQALPVIQQADTISCYLAVAGEIDLTPFICWCWQTNRTSVLPIVDPAANGKLVFQAYDADTPMQANQFAINEPVLDSREFTRLEQISVMLLPLVAFDSEKNRLGMGGGFYDRTLADYAQKKAKPVLIGVAHQCQYHDNTLPIEHWDVPLDYVVTPDTTF